MIFPLMYIQPIIFVVCIYSDLRSNRIGLYSGWFVILMIFLSGKSNVCALCWGLLREELIINNNNNGMIFHTDQSLRIAAQHAGYIEPGLV